METDETLYARIQKGDMAAFDELYARYEDKLFGFIRRYLKNSEQAEEVFHETFIKVLQNKTLDFSRGSFRGWLYLVARNASFNRLRSTKTAYRAYERIKNELEHKFNGEDKVIHLSLSKKVRAMSKELPDELKDVFDLRVQGLNQREISQALNIPLGTVKSRSHTMMERFKQELHQ